MEKYTVTMSDIRGIEWRNEAGQIHRLDGPAIEDHGNKWWFANGQLHRLDGPAVELIGKYKAWYKNGHRHRLDGPAIEWPDGEKEYWIEGEPFAEQEFLAKTKKSESQKYIVTVNGIRTTWQNEVGQFHRLDGPAIEDRGDKWWYQNGELHRLDGPAVEFVNGYKAWYKNSERHRLDGPAITGTDRIDQYWINGLLYTDQKSFLKKLNRLAKTQSSTTLTPTEETTLKSLAEKLGYRLEKLPAK